MEDIKAALSNLSESDEQDFYHVQTVRIPERVHARLQVLAQMQQSRSKTDLASRLLIRGVDDTFKKLFDRLDKLDEEYPGEGESDMVKDSIQARVDALYEKARKRHIKKAKGATE